MSLKVDVSLDEISTLFKDKKFEEVIKKIENNKELLKFKRGLLIYSEALEKCNNSEQALKMYDTLIERYHTDPWGYGFKIRLLNSMGKIKRASVIYLLALNIFKDDKSKINIIDNMNIYSEYHMFVNDIFQEDINKYKIDTLFKEESIIIKRPKSSHYIYNNNKFISPSIDIYLLKDAYITVDMSKNYQYKFYIFNSNMEYIKEFSFGDTPFISKNCISVLKNVAFIEDTFSKFNIAHLYFDKITRVYQFENYNIDEYIIFAKNNYIERVFALLDIQSLLINNTENKTVTFYIKNLYLTSSSFKNFKHPAQYMNNFTKHAIENMVKKFKKSIYFDKSIRRRIFIDRSRVKTRDIVNKDEFDSLLKKYNIEKVILEELPFEEQIRLFFEAELILGVHGAGLTNLIFANRNTTVIEILPPLCATITFWIPAVSLDMDYNSIIALDPDGIKPDYSKWQHKATLYNTKNIIIPIKEFDKLLASKINKQ